MQMLKAKPDGYSQTLLYKSTKGEFDVEFEDGIKIITKDLDYKLVKSLIWW